MYISQFACTTCICALPTAPAPRCGPRMCLYQTKIRRDEVNAFGEKGRVYVALLSRLTDWHVNAAAAAQDLGMQPCSAHGGRGLTLWGGSNVLGVRLEREGERTLSMDLVVPASQLGALGSALDLDDTQVCVLHTSWLTQIPTIILTNHSDEGGDSLILRPNVLQSQQ